eukprot:TRINITY_DN49979_c0_g1_i1.p2 TRINITY_DN49979_c0_g1~~TRINITY_DN49979_c0_g1_i1.p2  ORF type:complete len:124 (-),score=41.66 TRINITY_DN49979_c0_g1_i1:93-464(-)
MDEDKTLRLAINAAAAQALARPQAPAGAAAAAAAGAPAGVALPRAQPFNQPRAIRGDRGFGLPGQMDDSDDDSESDDSSEEELDLDSEEDEEMDMAERQMFLLEAKRWLLDNLGAEKAPMEGM